MLSKVAECRSIVASIALLVGAGCAATGGVSGKSADQGKETLHALVCRTKLRTPCDPGAVEQMVSLPAEGGTGRVRRGVQCGAALRTYDIRIDTARTGASRWTVQVREDVGGQAGSGVLTLGSPTRLELGDSSIEFTVELVDYIAGS